MVKLLDEIDAYLAGVKMSETTFGRKAVNDGKFVPRLRAGKRCWPETEERVRAYIRRASITDHPEVAA
ncbi:MAG: hypothetical protein ABS76_15620 [Pelagibacterium sp. SCN 64-44]|nr:MAG: hypothetical protein ABS76_15620 [Pelagibacterium sp. SCN 64-44]